ncbi:hypothetical protein BU25DRAFT_473817 [Macroventuria anomochaeta]|uniref:Uncharacterized protein n=1 Tax=Macroventuria anomochaeta TaxID=301207 RepID=A0ACB6RU70_9PLEO|nr:uncharacterized protein BU25DRAFT_473817 [Macroventuria anomochaeta]KAF2625262.1 hypothetical protein BU25DRAFT_473817 [Macroventuria anomochaeta]
MFYKSSLLPFKLRVQIWDKAVVPRTVKTTKKPINSSRFCSLSPHCHLVSSTPAPGSLQTCQEARNRGLYQRTFSGVAERLSAESRYVWVNLDILRPCTDRLIPQQFYAGASPHQAAQVRAHEVH